MRIFAAILILVGIAITVLAFMAGSIGFASGGFGLTCLAILLSYIAQLEFTNREGHQETVRVLKTGFDSLWKQMDAVRTGNTTPSQPDKANIDGPIPVYRTTEYSGPISTPPDSPIGKCPQCGIRRAQDVTRCVSCGSTQLVEFS